MTSSIYGLATSDSHANSVVAELTKAGFRIDDISVLFPDTTTSRDFAYEKHTKAPQGATAGGVTGGVVGGALGWMVGIGLLSIPGVGPFIAAGPIMAALSGAAIGATVGGLSGTLIGLGMPEYVAKRYEGKIQKGSILISVHVDDDAWGDRAKQVFRNAHVDDISSGEEAAATSPSRVGKKPSTK